MGHGGGFFLTETNQFGEFDMTSQGQQPVLSFQNTEKSHSSIIPPNHEYHPVQAGGLSSHQLQEQ
jgi:hypothetical protein